MTHKQLVKIVDDNKYYFPEIEDLSFEDLDMLQDNDLMEYVDSEDGYGDYYHVSSSYDNYMSITR